MGRGELVCLWIWFHSERVGSTHAKKLVGNIYSRNRRIFPPVLNWSVLLEKEQKNVSWKFLPTRTKFQKMCKFQKLFTLCPKLRKSSKAHVIYYSSGFIDHYSVKALALFTQNILHTLGWTHLFTIYYEWPNFHFHWCHCMFGTPIRLWKMFAYVT